MSISEPAKTATLHSLQSNCTCENATIFRQFWWYHYKIYSTQLHLHRHFLLYWHAYYINAIGISWIMMLNRVICHLYFLKWPQYLVPEGSFEKCPKTIRKCAANTNTHMHARTHRWFTQIYNTYVRYYIQHWREDGRSGYTLGRHTGGTGSSPAGAPP